MSSILRPYHINSRLHLEELQQWLDVNVKKYQTPTQVTLHSFEVNWNSLSGSFRVSLDETELSEKLTFKVDQSGKADFQLGIIHSPLGTPASYAVIELTESTSNAILNGLRKVIPRVLGCGINRESGKKILYYTPINERIIDVQEFDLARSLASNPDHSITVQI